MRVAFLRPHHATDAGRRQHNPATIHQDQSQRADVAVAQLGLLQGDQAGEHLPGDFQDDLGPEAAVVDHPLRGGAAFAIAADGPGTLPLEPGLFQRRKAFRVQRLGGGNQCFELLQYLGGPAARAFDHRQSHHPAGLDVPRPIAGDVAGRRQRPLQDVGSQPQRLTPPGVDLGRLVLGKYSRLGQGVDPD